ncbi:hypothetical protein M8C21_000548, partial [Ambrosia artemisiifolia]
GVCISAFIMSNVDDDNFDVTKQMEDMYKMLTSKFHYEKDKLERNRSTEQASSFGAISSCCVMTNKELCQPSFLSSWLDTLALNDYTSFGLDMRLLQESFNTVVLDGEELEYGLSCLHELLESTLSSLLNSSSRPPTDFSPHQKILWVLDARSSVNSAHASISCAVTEMWFNWHTSLWKHHLTFKKTNSSQHDDADLAPDMLFQPVATMSLDKILQSPIGIKDLSAHCLKLGVASRNLWLTSPRIAECHHFLLSSAQSLFQQIILAHEKAFEADRSSLTKLFSAQKVNASGIMSLLASSNHSDLKSLITQYIEPLLDELYSQNSTDSLFRLGCAWLRIGGLHYHLLVCCNDVDPAVKKSLKLNQLTESIASLELEIRVRQECVHLAGCFSLSEADKEKTRLLDKLKAERNRLQRRVVFRSDPGKFKKLKSECDEFMNVVKQAEKLLGSNMKRCADQIHGWQKRATGFVDRLSKEYSEYVDIIQPVQIAIYEMKLGFSLVLSSCLRDNFLDRIGQKNIDIVLGAIYSFTRFPRGLARKYVEDGFNAKLSKFDTSFPTYIGEDDMNMVVTLVKESARDNNKDEEGSVMQLEVPIRQNILLRVVHYVSHAHFLHNASFELLHKMFKEFANCWKKKAIDGRTKEERDSQLYRLRPRAFELKDIIEIDVATLESSISNEAFSEWQELADEEVEASVEKNVYDEHVVLEEDWNLLLGDMLNEMLNVYITIFGSVDLLQPGGFIQVSDSDRMRSFLDSYTLGTRAIRGDQLWNYNI